MMLKRKNLNNEEKMEKNKKQLEALLVKTKKVQKILESQLNEEDFNKDNELLAIKLLNKELKQLGFPTVKENHDFYDDFKVSYLKDILKIGNIFKYAFDEFGFVVTKSVMSGYNGVYEFSIGTEYKKPHSAFSNNDFFYKITISLPENKATVKKLR